MTSSCSKPLRACKRFLSYQLPTGAMTPIQAQLSSRKLQSSPVNDSSNDKHCDKSKQT